ncbi:hypothetical protein ACNTMI_27550, partial [Klebsiella pneumoniae]
MQAALQAVRRHGAHAQGTLSYTTSPAHTLQTWLDLTEQLLETGVDSVAPVAAQLDDVGYRSLECWGGATFDACIRFLGEDPWVRLRELKKAMPKTPLQMLLRGQNLLGYRHYADDVVERFVERAVKNGMDVFRVFDAMNDPRNMQAALQAVRRHGAHAQGTLSYTTSPAYTLQTWLDLTEQLLETGVDSVAKRYDVTLHLHCHATTGMAEMALLKAIEAGVDGVDTAISSMSATYGHPATEALVATLAGTPYDTGLDIHRLESIAAYFREVRKKYHAFEGQLKGTDSRILVAQVPGGMLTNLESQLKQQSAAHRLDEVLAEIPRKRYDVTLHLHCHATTGMAEMALLKAIEAGVDGVDTAISSMSATYGHPATEALVATLAGTPYDTGLNIHRLESIAAYFREVRKKYHAFEGQLKGTDSRILVAQVPGGMLTNLEGQLKQQSAAHRLDEVLAEIP